MFIGTHNAKLDDKGRLVFPSPLKIQYEGGGKLRFVVKKNMHLPCLEMFTVEEWQRETNNIVERLHRVNISLDEESNKFWSTYMNDIDIVEPDEKMGRIFISKELLDKIGVTKDVVFSGKLFKIELWAKENFKKEQMSGQDFRDYSNKLKVP